MKRNDGPRRPRKPRATTKRTGREKPAPRDGGASPRVSRAPRRDDDRPRPTGASRGADESPRLSRSPRRDDDRPRTPRPSRDDDRPRDSRAPRRDDDRPRYPRAPRPDDDRPRSPRAPRSADESPRFSRAPRRDDERPRTPRFRGGDDRPRYPRAPRRDDDRPRSPRAPRSADESPRFSRAPRRGDERPTPRFQGGDDRPRYPRAPRRDDDRPRSPGAPSSADESPRFSRAPRRDDERPRTLRFQGGDDRPRYPRAPRRDDDRPRSPRGADASPRFSRPPRRDDERPPAPRFRDDDRPTYSRAPRMGDDRPRYPRGPQRDDDRPRAPRSFGDRPRASRPHEGEDRPPSARAPRGRDEQPRYGRTRRDDDAPRPFRERRDEPPRPRRGRDDEPRRFEPEVPEAAPNLAVLYGESFAPFVASIIGDLTHAAADLGHELHAISVESLIAGGSTREDIDRLYILPFDLPPERDDLRTFVRQSFPRADVLNSQQAHELCWDKLQSDQRLLSRGVPVPGTLFTESPDEVRAFVAEHRFAILKERFSCGGQGHVVLCDTTDVLVGEAGQRRFVVELTDDKDAPRRLAEGILTYPAPFFVQRLVGDEGARDTFTPGRILRAYVLDGRVAFWAERYRDRYLRPADWIVNVGLGAKYRFVLETSEEMRKLAVRAADALGMRVGAIDIVRARGGTFVLEGDTDGRHMYIDRTFKHIPDFRRAFDLDRMIAAALANEEIPALAGPV